MPEGDEAVPVARELRGDTGLFLALLDRVNLRAIDADDAMVLRAALASGRALAAQLDEMAAQRDGEALLPRPQALRPIRALTERLGHRWHGVADQFGVVSLRIEVGDGARRALLADQTALDRVVDSLIGAALVQSIGAEVTVLFAEAETEGLDLVIAYGGTGPRFLSRYGAQGIAEAERKAEAMGLRITQRRPAAGRYELVLHLPLDLLLPGGFAPDSLPDLSTLRISVSGGDLEGRSLVSAMLRSMGAVVGDIADGMDRPSLLVTDLDGLDGRETETLIAASQKYPDTPQVALSSDLPGLPANIGATVSALVEKPLANLEDFGALMARLAAGRDTGEIQLEPRLYDGLSRMVGEDILPDVLDELARDLGEIAAQIEAALSGPVRGKIRVQAYLLASIAGLIGATRLGKLARQVSQLSLEGEDEPLGDAAGICLAAIRAYAQDAAHTAARRRASD